MRTLIPTLTLVTTLALTAFSEAGPRQRKVAPPTSHLNALEHLCQTMGALAYKFVESRDAGVSYFTLLEELRRFIAQHPPTSYVERSIAASTLDNLRMVYDTPYVTPAGNRQVTERMCLRELERYVQEHNTTAAKDRY